jgi:1-acyl-sn-glycerol-3-phosphate acyltransferase
MIALVPFGAVFFMVSFAGLRKPMALLTYKTAQLWAKLLIKCAGCKLTVAGTERIPRKEGVCFVSNHGSIFDIALMLAYAGRPFGFIAKKELIWIPFLNMWIFLLGGLFIDRKNARKALVTINKGVKKIQNNGAMIIFPEGKRSRGQGLLPFHAGSLKLATQSDAIITPVAIKGSYEFFEKTMRVQNTPVSLTFAPPIFTADIPRDDRKQRLADMVRAVIAEALQAN